MKDLIATIKQNSIVSKFVFILAALGIVGAVGFGTVAAQSSTTEEHGTGYAKHEKENENENEKEKDDKNDKNDKSDKNDKEKETTTTRSTRGTKH